MNDVARLFTGKAGEHAVASQFLIRNWIVAFPALDLGVDLLIADHSYGQARRVQVKTANAQEQQRSYVAQFSLPVSRLATPLTSELIYVLAVFRIGRWSDFLKSLAFLPITRTARGSITASIRLTQVDEKSRHSAVGPRFNDHSPASPAGASGTHAAIATVRSTSVSNRPAVAN